MTSSRIHGRIARLQAAASHLDPARATPPHNIALWACPGSSLGDSAVPLSGLKPKHAFCTSVRPFPSLFCQAPGCLSRVDACMQFGCVCAGLGMAKLKRKPTAKLSLAFSTAPALRGASAQHRTQKSCATSTRQPAQILQTLQSQPNVHGRSWACLPANNPTLQVAHEKIQPPILTQRGHSKA